MLRKDGESHRTMTEEERQIAEAYIGYATGVAVSIAKRWGSKDIDNMVSLSWVTLCESVMTFDKERKVTFDSYLFACILNSMRSEVRKEMRVKAVCEKMARCYDRTGVDYGANPEKILTIDEDELQRFVDIAEKHYSKKKLPWKDKVRPFVLTTYIAGCKRKEVMEMLEIDAATHTAISKSLKNFVQKKEIRELLLKAGIEPSNNE